MSTYIITGDVCTNTCFGYGPQDIFPDYLGLFGPTFGDLGGMAFTLTLNFDWTGTLTINNHTILIAVNALPHLISFNSPLLDGFATNTILFQASGLNPYGLGALETEYLCPIPGVPEAPIWAMLIAGAMIVGCLRSISRIHRQSIALAA